MNHFTYPQIPTLALFQRDSSVTFAIRSDDIIIKHIDWILERYHARVKTGNEPVAPAILCHLFMSCNFWIKSFHEGNKRMKKERYPAVLALFEATVARLCPLLRTSRNNLSNVLEEIYGRDMHAHGFAVDNGSKRAKYLSKTERQIYRMRFKGGRVYQYPWWSKSPVMTLEPADSKRAYTDISRKGEDGNRRNASKNFGCFVMTLEREFYMAKPEVGEVNSESGMFHSSLVGGDIVSMAGSMMIKNGKILAVRCDSGHYKPTRMNMALMLQALAMYGVDLRTIRLYDFDGADMGVASEFLKSKMTWSEFEKRRREERAHRIVAEETRQQHGLPSRFPNLPKRAPAPPPRPQLVNNIVATNQVYLGDLSEVDPAELYQTA